MQSNNNKKKKIQISDLKKGRSKVNFNQPNKTHQKVNRQGLCIHQKILKVPGMYSKFSKEESRYDKWNEITNYGKVKFKIKTSRFCKLICKVLSHTRDTYTLLE